jgi:hypothetical protein
MTPKASYEMTETQMVGMIRNAVLVAGYEMGKEGDHWPVINDTIHSIARDWQEVQTQKDVDAELQVHLYEQLAAMEQELPNCDPQLRAELEPKLKELREIYDSYFMPLSRSAIVPILDCEIPMYLKRAEAIVETLGGEHE